MYSAEVDKHKLLSLKSGPLESYSLPNIKSYKSSSRTGKGFQTPERSLPECVTVAGSLGEDKNESRPHFMISSRRPPSERKKFEIFSGSKVGDLRTGKNPFRTEPRNIQSYQDTVISYIENKAQEVGIGVYNIKTGEFILTKSQENSFLTRLIKENFKSLKVKAIKRNWFDETAGFQIFSQSLSYQNLIDHDFGYLSFASFNALICYLQEMNEQSIEYSTLKVEFQQIDEVMIIEETALRDLELLLNKVENTQKNSLVSGFKCNTSGGARMLRGNLLQPLTNVQELEQRLDFVDECVNDKAFSFNLANALKKLKNFEIVTAKFIYKFKKSDIKSLNQHFSNILMLHGFMGALGGLKNLIFQKKIGFFQNLIELFNNTKFGNIIGTLERNINHKENVQNIKKSDQILYLLKVSPDSVLEITKITFSQTLENLNCFFDSIKHKLKKVDLKLNYTLDKGYLFFVKKSDLNKIPLESISSAIGDDLWYVTENSKGVTFSTSNLMSLNNRLNECYCTFIKQAESQIHMIVLTIQENIDILFKISFLISTVDMLNAFAQLGSNHKHITSRPVFSKDLQVLWMKNGRNPIIQICDKKVTAGAGSSRWLSEIGCLLEKGLLLYSKMNEIFANILNSTQIFFGFNGSGKTTLLKTIALNVILAQIGCYVFCESFVLSPVSIILSKFTANDKIESKASGFSTEISLLKKLFGNVRSEQGGSKISNQLILVDGFTKMTSHEDISCLSFASLEYLLIHSTGFVFITSNDTDLLQAKSKYTQIENHVLGNSQIDGSEAASKKKENFILRKWVQETEISPPDLNKTLELNAAPVAFIKSYEKFKTILKPEERRIKIKSREEEYIERLKECIKQALVNSKGGKIQPNPELLGKYFK